MLTRTSLIIRLHPDDDVVIARGQLVGGTKLLDEQVTVTGLVPPGHKIATRSIAKGQPVKRYNQIIGFASRDIAPGEHVHLHNLAMGAFDRDFAFGADAKPTQFVNPPATFEGIVRDDGRVATRNYIGILSTVNCSATVARGIADHFRGEALAAFPNVDGVVALTHGSGCGMDTHGEGMQLLRRTLGGYARHANFAGVLVIGLGCEANQIGALFGAENLEEGPLLRTFSIQDTGGTAKTIAHGVGMIEEMLPHANEVTRRTVPASHIVVGLQCGGSDGYSGITANPALGAAVDLLVRHGGTAILSETPEIYGAEHLLIRRAVSEGVAKKLIDRYKWWEWYCRGIEAMDNNPAPGNKAGGITTVFEKSLGGVTKGGTTPMTDVFLYGEPITTRGFVFMDTPGHDPVSITGLVAGG
jgi:arabinonate dehydratase